jgi:hypothetical protein
MLPEKPRGGTLKAALGDNLGRMPGCLATPALFVLAARLKFSLPAPIAMR